MRFREGLRCKKLKDWVWLFEGLFWFRYMPPIHISIPGCAEWGLKLNLGNGKLGPTVLNLVKRSARIYRPFLATLPVSLSLFISLHHRSWIKKEEKAKVVAAVVAALVIVHYRTFWIIGRIVPGWFEEKDLFKSSSCLILYIASQRRHLPFLLYLSFFYALHLAWPIWWCFLMKENR